MLTLGCERDLSVKHLKIEFVSYVIICCKSIRDKFIDIKFLVQHSTGYVFQVGKNTKTSRQGKPRSPTDFIPFTENQKLYVCHYIDLHLYLYYEYHEKESQLLLNFIEPHEAILILTISRWIIEVLTLSVFETKVSQIILRDFISF